MSSHREAPEISKDPVADSADLYAFVSPDDPNTITIIANYVPLQQPAGGPNFYEFGDDVLYEIHIDNDNDADANITYQFRFRTVLTDTGPNDIFLYNTGQIMHLSDTTWNRKQFYSVTRLDRFGSHVLATNLPCPPCNVGKNSIPSYAPLTAEAIHPLGSGGKVFAGQRADGFYVDLGSVFDLGDLRSFQPDFLIKRPAMPGINTLAGLNVHSIAIQVPISQLTSDGKRPDNYKAADSTIGVWTTASRQKGSIGGYGGFSAGPWSQLSRLGMPLINEVIIPMGRKDYWNSQQPRNDSQFGHFYDHPALAALLNTLYPGVFPNIATYTATASTTRPDLDAVLLTGVPAGLFAGFQNYTGATKADLLRLNVAIPPTTSASSVNILGVIGGDIAGFPNGRRVVDDVVSVELKAVAGALLPDVVPSFTPDAGGVAGSLFDVGAAQPTTIADLASASASTLTIPARSPISVTPGTAMTTRRYRTSPSVATPEVTEVQAMYWGTHAHPHEGAHPNQHGGLGPTPGTPTSRAGAEPSPPTEPSRAVFLDIGEHAGALVLKAPSEREGMEVEIHPVSDPSQHTHVWVLPRQGKEGTVYAAVFPSLAIGDYAVLEPDGSVATTVAIKPNVVTNATWG